MVPFCRTPEEGKKILRKKSFLDVNVGRLDVLRWSSCSTDSEKTRK
jgi:hypothetical protein